MASKNNSGKGAPSSSANTLGKKKKVTDGAIAVGHRNGYMKIGAKRLTIAAAIAIFALIAQIFVAYLAFTAKSERVYIATDKNGSLINLIALNRPNQKNEAVAQWVQNALVESFSFNFTDYKRVLNRVTMAYFTEHGASEFTRELKASGYLDTVVDSQMILSLGLESTPIFIGSGISQTTGIYTWGFQVDSIITFRTRSKEVNKKIRMTIIVERRSLLEDSDGFGIAKIVLAPRS